MEDLKLIGYWQAADHPEYPHPRIFVRKDWDPELKRKVLCYLREGLVYRGSWGFSFCRFDESRDFREMGSKELSDGVFLWPEGLAVYVDEYDVGLPGDFLKHMKSRNFQLPPADGDDVGRSGWLPEEKGRKDDRCSFWIDWTGKFQERLANGQSGWDESESE